MVLEVSMASPAFSESSFDSLFSGNSCSGDLDIKAEGTPADALQLFPALSDVNRVEPQWMDVNDVDLEEEDELLVHYLTDWQDPLLENETDSYTKQKKNVAKTAHKPVVKPVVKPGLKVRIPNTNNSGTPSNSYNNGIQLLKSIQTNVIQVTPVKPLHVKVPSESLYNCRQLLSDDDAGQCMSKNAVAARENRVRKKEHVSMLESTVKELSTENVRLKADMLKMKSGSEQLREEVKYLRGILANQSAIASLLANIPNAKGVRLSSSFTRTDQQEEESEDEIVVVEDGVVSRRVRTGSKRKCDSSVTNSSQSKFGRMSSMDHSYAGDYGVCLHVKGDSVSIEMCEKCHRKAASSRDS